MMQPARERPGTAAQKGIGHRMQTALMGWVHQLGTLEYWEALLAGFEGLGPLVPILLAMVESFFPPLPLIAIVALNVAAHGGLLGFLIYNFNPAKVFMGDTGSLFLGGAVAALAFAYDMPLILVTVGIMYIVEALSDIIQVGYFKLTHGKRVFRMSPFHHHLEMGGWTGHKWKEKQIVALFAGVTVLFAVLSFIGVFHRFGA